MLRRLHLLVHHHPRRRVVGGGRRKLRRRQRHGRGVKRRGTCDVVVEVAQRLGASTRMRILAGGMGRGAYGARLLLVQVLLVPLVLLVLLVVTCVWRGVAATPRRATPPSPIGGDAILLVPRRGGCTSACACACGRRRRRCRAKPAS